MKIIAINGFNLPAKKVGIWKYAGFLSRKSHVFVKYEDNYEKLINSNDANNEFMSMVSKILTDDEYQVLNLFRSKIEKPNEHSVELAKKVIDDYSFIYIDKSWYNSTSQFNLIKLEQLFIQYNFESCYIDKYSKPSASTYNGHNVFNILFKITGFKWDKIDYLKMYIDEYFQYLFDMPKNIWTINNLNLPKTKNDRSHLEIQQYASYLNRKSLVKVKAINYTLEVKNIVANESFMSWFRSISSENEDLIKLIDYRNKLENLDDNVIKLGKELVTNYYNDENFYNQQCLINLEQFLIRYNIPTSYVLDCMNAKYTKSNDYYNSEVIEWISKITNKDKNKIKKLKNYLDEYLFYTVNRTKEEFNRNFQKDQEIENDCNICDRTH
jgi:hypothetical protein